MVTLSKTLQQTHERQGDTFNRIPVRYIGPSFFRDCRSCVPILANARVAKLTFFGMLYIRRCPFRVAGLGHQGCQAKSTMAAASAPAETAHGWFGLFLRVRMASGGAGTHPR